MITELQVIEAVCKYLKKLRFSVTQQLCTSERGDDIIARTPDDSSEVAIEAKGGTSSKSHTKRFGKPFDGSQVIVHVSRAFYSAAARYSESRRYTAIALPLDHAHQKCVDRILPALAQLQIEVFWVDAKLKVRHVGHWKSWQKWSQAKNASKPARRTSR